MFNEPVGIRDHGAMGELVIAALHEVKILAAVRDHTIAGPQTGVDGYNACIIGIIDHGFVQRQFRRPLYRCRQKAI